MLEKTAHRLDQPHRSSATEEILISTTNLSYQTNGKTLLSAIDLNVQKGQIVTIIGPNGAGKTTLLKLLLGILKPSSGEIIRKPGLRIGYVPQKFSIDKTIPLNVRRFLALQAPNSVHSNIAALEKVGADHLLDRQIAELSGGEFQRVVLARAISNRPELLILDEPVQGVDYSGEAELYQLIENIRNQLQCAVVLVSHDLHIVMAASDEVICLNQHICCSGVPQSVGADPEYRRLFGPNAADAADGIALYHHVHDHHHDITGNVCEHDHLPDHDHSKPHNQEITRPPTAPNKPKDAAE